MPKKDAIQGTKPKTSAKAKSKATAKGKRSPGRPKVVIDWARVDKYLQAHCTGTEIAAALGIHRETLYDACLRDNKTEFSTYSQRKKESGDVLLRVKLFDLAMKGDRATAMFLSKNRLGYRDKPKDEDETDNGPKNITFTISEELIEAKEDGTEKGTKTDRKGDQLQGHSEGR